MDHFEKIQDETGNQIAELVCALCIQNFLTCLILNMFLTLCL